MILCLLFFLSPLNTAPGPCVSENNTAAVRCVACEAPWLPCTCACTCAVASRCRGCVPGGVRGRLRRCGFSSDARVTCNPLLPPLVRNGQKLDEEQIAEIREAFNLFDTDSSGECGACRHGYDPCPCTHAHPASQLSWLLTVGRHRCALHALSAETGCSSWRCLCSTGVVCGADAQGRSLLLALACAADVVDLEF